MRATMARTILALLAVAVCPPPAGADSPTTSAALAKLAGPTAGDALIAESFRASAVAMTCSAPETPARAGRLVVLCRFADRLVPGQAATNRLLADIYLAQGRGEQEAAALERYLADRPNDYAVGVRWLVARLQPIQTADGRADMLRRAIERKDLPAPLRAEAAAMLAKVLHGQGKTPEALAAAKRAVELDAYGPSGLAIGAALEEPSSGPGETDLRLRMLRGEPRAAGQAWQVALRLGQLGLHKEAVSFIEHAWLGGGMAAKVATVPNVLLVQYGNALLDANDANAVVSLLAPLAGRTQQSADLSSLLLEAYQSAGEDKKAKHLAETMAVAYKERETGGEASEAFSAELGWFYATTSPRASLAIIHARRAVAADANNPVYQRILGAAELVGGRRLQGQAKLKPLLGKDPYASILLAERHYAADESDQAKQAILAAVKLPRSGPAYRRLAALAAKHGVTIPPAEGSQEALQLVKSFDTRYLQMLREPEKFLAVELKARREACACAEPIEAVATLRNIGPVPVPLGQRGLCRPVLALRVTVRGQDAKLLAVVKGLPMAVWPAPRYLPPAGSVETTVRLDVAELAGVLAHRPLEDLTLDVSAVLDPSAEGAPALPTLKVAPAKIARTSLLGALNRQDAAAWPRAYAVALGRIVGAIRRGDEPQRMLAARQAASALAFARDIENRKVRAPAPMGKTIDKLVLLSITRALLQDRSPAVRQEMIAALHHVDLDEIVIRLLAPAIQDPHPAVRCRLIELLAGARTTGHRTILQLLAKDADELVRAMAAAFAAE